MRVREIKIVPMISIEMRNDKSLDATHRDLVVDAFLDDPIFNKNRKTMRAATRIEEAFDRANGSAILTEEDWMMLRDVAEEPAQGYAWKPHVMRALAPMIDAIIDAEEIDKD